MNEFPAIKDMASSCGEDLEYAPEFVALQQASIGKSEQQFGTAIIPAEPPDWHRIEDEARQLLRRSQDIRILGLLTRAWTENEGIAGYARGLQWLAELLEQHWEAVHPRLQTADEYDPMQRVNAIAAFADTVSLARSLRKSALLAGSSGHLSLRDAAAILEGGDSSENLGYPGGSVRLRAELGQARGDTAATLIAVDQILASVSRVRQVMEKHLDTAWMPSFAPIEQPLNTISAAVSVRRGLHEISGQALSVAPPSVAEAEEAAAPDLGAGTGLPAGHIDGRDEVIRMLQQACDYLERSEPSHPAPMLIRRSLRLLQMNFYEIVRELMPEGLSRLDALAGTGNRDGASPPAKD